MKKYFILLLCAAALIGCEHKQVIILLDLTDAMYEWEYRDQNHKLGWLTIRANDSIKGFEVFMDFQAGATPSGHFTTDDLGDRFMDFNHIRDKNVQKSFAIVVADVTGTLNLDTVRFKPTYTFGGYVITEDGVKYTFTNVVAKKYP